MTDILIIEHDANTEQFLVQALAAQGYSVATARSGKEGLALAETLLPGVIICDWTIPGELDGLALCQALKQHPTLYIASLLLLTSRYSAADRVKGLEMGADDLLSKPVDINELNARVRAGLRLYQLTQDLRQQKQRMEAELAEAESYVRSLLPTDQVGKVPIQSRFLPSRQLGGDCYDYYWLDPDYLVIYLLDVSGHGLGSALLSTSVLNVLRSQSLPDVSFYRPEKVLRALNETFQMGDQNQKYFTIWYGVLNCANRQLLYASAGHPPAVLVSISEDQTVSTLRLRTPGMPVGMLPDAKYKWQRCQIPPNSSLYLFSDGLYEVLQNNQQYIGLDAFVELLTVARREKGIDHIMQSVIRLQASEIASDDMSLMMVNID
ncbi:MAG: SpoIIE family protein phosphatase [Leptolyngbyaceae cyanobacterium SM2_5_2]|nr:SpoIIE family protein phosphatase [Leptolyngbyaceae cyanobacterium SM2_5_2]